MDMVGLVLELLEILTSKFPLEQCNNDNCL